MAEERHTPPAADGIVEPLHPSLGDPPTIDRLLDDVDDHDSDNEDLDSGPWDDVPTISDFPALPLPDSTLPTSVTAVAPVPPIDALITPPPELIREIREQVRSEVLSEVREAVWYQARAVTLQESWTPLVERIIELYAELERSDATMGTASDGGADANRDAAGELSRHMRLRLQEILGRGGVTILSEATAGFDRTLHDLARGIPPPPDGTPIARFLSPAFLVDGRVLRRARVELTGMLPDSAKAIDSKITEQAPPPLSVVTPDLPHDDEEGDTLEVPPLSL
jgi:hypothetical protein